MGVLRSPVVLLLAAVLLGGASCDARPAGPGAAPPPSPARSTTPQAVPGEQPSWALLLPPATRQVVRTVSSDRWCDQVHCTVTQAWARHGDTWRLVRELRSSISPGGWGKRQQDDLGTPEGIYEIKVTFSTSSQNPGRMSWRRRLPTSTVTDEEGPLYNTWIEEPGRTDGDRPSMRWGFVVDYNAVRLSRGGPRRAGRRERDLLPHLASGPPLGAERGLHPGR